MMYLRRYSDPPTAEQKLQAQVDSVAFQRYLFHAANGSVVPANTNKFCWLLADNAVWHIRDATISQEYIGPDLELGKTIHRWFTETKERATTRWSPKLVDVPPGASPLYELLPVSVRPNSANVRTCTRSKYLWPTPLFAWIAASAKMKNEEVIKTLKHTLMVSNGMCDIVLFGVRNCKGHNPLEFARFVKAAKAEEFLLPFYPEAIKEMKESRTKMNFQQLLVSLLRIQSNDNTDAQYRLYEETLWNQMTELLSSIHEHDHNETQNNAWHESCLHTLSDNLKGMFPNPLFAAIYICDSQSIRRKQIFAYLQTTGGMSNSLLQSKNSLDETPVQFALKIKLYNTFCEIFPYYGIQEQLIILDEIMQELGTPIVEQSRKRPFTRMRRFTPTLQFIHSVISDTLWARWIQYRADVSTAMIINFLKSMSVTTHSLAKLIIRMLQMIYPKKTLFEHVLYIAVSFSHVHLCGILLLPEILDIVQCQYPNNTLGTVLILTVLARNDDILEHMKILFQHLSVSLLEHTWIPNNLRVKGTLLHHIMSKQWHSDEYVKLIDILAVRHVDISFMTDENGQTARQCLVDDAFCQNVIIRLSVLEDITAKRHSQIMEQVQKVLPSFLPIKDLIVAVGNYIIATREALMTGNFDRQLILHGRYHEDSDDNASSSFL